MYRAYRDHPFAQPQQPYDAWQHNPAPAVPHAYPPPIEPAIAAPAYPVRQAYPHPAYSQAWQPMPPAQAHYQPYAYAQPPSASPYYPSQPFHAHEAGQRPMDAYSALDEIRASLREFREALNDLAERRSRRRIF